MAGTGLQCVDADVHRNLQRGEGVVEAVGYDVLEEVFFEKLFQPVIDCVRVDRFAVLLDEQSFFVTIPCRAEY